jgi:hypothetical protein
VLERIEDLRVAMVGYREPRSRLKAVRASIEQGGGPS